MENLAHNISEKKISVEVAYATPERQAITRIIVTVGTTLLEAAKQSEIGTLFPELDLNNAEMGIWSKPQPNNTKLLAQSGQRIEIYRPLIADPKQARRNRAEKRTFKNKPIASKKTQKHALT